MVSQPDPNDGRGRIGKNRIVGLGLAAVVLLLFLVTLVRLKGL